MTSSNTQSPLDTIAAQALGTDHPPAAPAAPAVQAAPAVPEGPSFESLGLSADIVSALTAAGYQVPTPVQQRAIPAALAGRDLLVSSPTGSGKTAAFMLPAIERFSQLEKLQASQPREPRDPNGRPARRQQPVARPSLLVLTPTRELAMQVTAASTTYGKHLRRLRTVSILGGVAYGQQLMLLAKNPEILVATPGRLLDHLERGRIDLSNLHDARARRSRPHARHGLHRRHRDDRRRDAGFAPDAAVLGHLDGKISSLTGRLLKDPERIEIVQKLEARNNIAQTVHYVDDRDHKDRLLDHLLARRRPRSGDRVHRDQERRRPTGDSPGRRRFRIGGAARRPAARRAQPHDPRTARAPCARAGGNRRRRSRHRHPGRHARVQLRPAEVRRRLRAPHRPYRPRGPHGHGGEPRASRRARRAEAHRTLRAHAAGGERHRWLRAAQVGTGRRPWRFRRWPWPSGRRFDGWPSLWQR